MWTIKSSYFWRNWRRNLIQQIITESVRASLAAGISRPIRFKVQSSDSVYQILRKAKQLRDTEGYERVFISPDRTVEERISRQKLVNELKEKRAADPNKHYIIRKGEVVFLSERTGCVDNV